MKVAHLARAARSSAARFPFCCTSCQQRLTRLTCPRCSSRAIHALGTAVCARITAARASLRPSPFRSPASDSASSPSHSMPRRKSRRASSSPWMCGRGQSVNLAHGSRAEKDLRGQAAFLGLCLPADKCGPSWSLGPRGEPLALPGHHKRSDRAHGWSAPGKFGTELCGHGRELPKQA